MRPVLSVIVPAFNAERYLAEAIASLQAQTLNDLEIIVVDDGSTDGSWGIVVGLGAQDSRIRGVRQPHGGLCAARNAGLACARGELVAFLDADDRWLPDKARRHVEHLRGDASIDVSFGWYAVIDEDGRDTGRRGRCRPGAYTVAQLLRQNIVFPGYPVIRRAAVEAAGPFDSALPASEDFDFILRLAGLRDGNTACIPEVLAAYRRHPGQLSSNWRLMEEGWTMAMERARRRVPAAVAVAEREATALHDRYLAYLAWESGDYASARLLLMRAWRAHPLAVARDRRTWPTTAATLATVLPGRVRAPLQDLAVRARRRGARALQRS